MVKGLLKPLSALTGGVVPAEPVPNPVQLAAPGPQGSAAKIKKDQLEAPHRLDAIKQLGTVDCHWYPEAADQLTLALRSDRSECVRFEAAKILSRCNCCSPKMVHALKICVAGTNFDGNPGERSIRIRNQAAVALTHCLACVDNGGEDSTTPLRPEYPISPGAMPIGTAPGYHAATTGDEADRGARLIAQVGYEEAEQADGSVIQGQGNLPTAGSLSMESEVSSARKVLEQFRQLQQSVQVQLQTQTQPSMSLSDAWKKSK